MIRLNDPPRIAKSFYPISRKHPKAIILIGYQNREIQKAKSFEGTESKNPLLYPYATALEEQFSYFQSVNAESLSEDTRKNAGYETVQTVFLMEGMDISALPPKAKLTFDSSLSYIESGPLRLPLERFFNSSPELGSPNASDVRRECKVLQKDFSFDEILNLKCSDSSIGRDIRDLLDSWKKYEKFRKEQEQSFLSLKGDIKNYDIIILGLQEYGARTDNSSLILPFSIASVGIIPYTRDYARFIVTYIYESDTKERMQTHAADLRQILSPLVLPLHLFGTGFSPRQKTLKDGFHLLNSFLSKDDFYLPTFGNSSDKTPLWTEAGEIFSLSNGKVQIRHIKNRVLRPGLIVYPNRDENRGIKILTSSHTYVEGILNGNGRLIAGEKVYLKKADPKESQEAEDTEEDTNRNRNLRKFY